MSTTKTTLTALSPLDGRYSAKLTELASIFSDVALTKNRVLVEVEYLIFLSTKKLIGRFSADQKRQLRSMVAQFAVDEAQQVQEIERQTKHDVKAVEYFLREYLKKNHLPNEASVHLCLTSEDVNSLAYGLMLAQGKEVLEEELSALLRQLADFARDHRDVVMLARTHGQLAVPTTVGKEIAVFAQRLLTELELLRTLKIEGKMTGAVGNLNAHTSAFTNESMLSFSEEFVASLGLTPNVVTTQILPPESYTRFFSSLVRCNGILLDLTQDCWRYISDGYFEQKLAPGQIGSSTMPQKINPIDFENSEGNLGLAQALLLHFIQKLPVSRLQRDLSDSTVKRSIGSALGYCHLAYLSLRAGLQKITVSPEKTSAMLQDHWEVVAEAYQVILRKNNVSDGYEQLKTLTQGKQLSDDEARTWIGQLSVHTDIKKELASITPQTYIGQAVAIADLVLRRISNFFERTA